MQESDWKTFKKIKERALEAFCNGILKEVTEQVNQTDQSAHNRYQVLYQLLERRDKQIELIFDGHSRSKAAIQLMLIRGEGLADEGLLQKLSAEFLEQTDPNR